MAEQALGSDASISGGIAVVHYKEDLRFALSSARRAEKAAKGIGKNALPDSNGIVKKDALAITICRHSGEHSLSTLGWQQCIGLQTLVNDFSRDNIKGINGVSDRWTYKFRDEAPSIEHLPLNGIVAELSRLLQRVEAAPKGFQQRVKDLFGSYHSEMSSSDRNWHTGEIVEHFATLCQTAGFLARGRD